MLPLDQDFTEHCKHRYRLLAAVSFLIWCMLLSLCKVPSRDCITSVLWTVDKYSFDSARICFKELNVEKFLGNMRKQEQTHRQPMCVCVVGGLCTCAINTYTHPQTRSTGASKRKKHFSCTAAATSAPNPPATVKTHLRVPSRTSRPGCQRPHPWQYFPPTATGQK